MTSPSALLPQKPCYNFGQPHGIWTSVKSLGAGAFGKVELVTNSKQQLAAVKIVNLSAMKSEDRKSAQNEVSLMATKLQPPHPHIIRYYSSYEKDGNLYILLEYANRGDLSKLIEKFVNKTGGGLPEQLVGAIFSQLVSAIHYLHSRKILHRDLKTANVFLTTTSSTTRGNNNSNEDDHHDQQIQVKLGDFGISRVLKNTMSLARTCAGTPYYFSPELACNRPYNNKSDVWSCGVILYELVTGRKCFDANNLKALMCKIIKGNYPPIDTTKYSRTIQDVIDGMLQQKVEKRFSIRQVAQMEFVRRHSTTSTTTTENNTKDTHQQQSSASSSPLARGPKIKEDPTTGKKNNQLVINPITSRAMMHARNKNNNNNRFRQIIDKNVNAVNNNRNRVEPMKYIKRRVEIGSYEDQQNYVNRGKDYIQQVRDQQEQRQKVHDTRSARIQELRKQLEVIEKRHQEIRTQRNNNNKQSTTPSRSDEYYAALQAHEESEKQYQEFLHQKQHQNKKELSFTPRREPTAAELRNFYRNRQSVDSPWYNNNNSNSHKPHHHHHHQNLQLQGQALLNYAEEHHQHNNRLAPSKLPDPDSEYSGKRDLKQFVDVDEVLTRESNSNSLNPEEAEKAKELWRMHKERIELARQLELEQNTHHEEGEKQTRRVSKQQWKKPRIVQKQQQENDDDDNDDSDEEEEEEEEETDNDDEEEEEEEDETTMISFSDDDEELYNEDWKPEDEGKEIQQQQQHQQQQTRKSSSLQLSLYNPEFNIDEDDGNGNETENEQQQEESFDDYFEEEEPNPQNIITTATKMHLRKFTLDGKTLKLQGIDENSTDAARAMALREFLLNGLGNSQELFDDIYNRLRIIETTPNLDEAEEMMKNLEKATNNSKRLIDLMIQLRVVEEQQK